MAANIVDITVEDIADKLDSYNQIQLESSTSYSGSYSLIDTIILVANTYVYQFADTSGTINTWYRWRFYNSLTTAASDYTTSFNTGGVNQLRIRQYLLENHRCGMVLLTGSGCSTTLIQTDDYRFKNTVYRDDRGKNSSIYIADGALAGTGRYVKSSSVSAGTMTVDLMGGTPAAGVTIEWCWTALHETLNTMINKALLRYWYLDRIPIDGVVNQNEYSLDAYGWLSNPRDLMGMWYVPGGGSGIPRPWDGEGRWWNYRTDQGVLSIDFSPSIGDTDVVYLEALRQMPQLYDDTALLPANPDLELCAALAYDELLKWLCSPGQGGTSEDYKAWRIARSDLKPTLAKLLKRNTPKVNMVMPRSSAPIISGPRPWRAR